MSNRQAVVSQGWDFKHGGWDSPAEFLDFEWDDEHVAKEEAGDHARLRLNYLINERRSGGHGVDFPLLERILVCPRLAGAGRNGEDYLETGARTLTLTIGVE